VAKTATCEPIIASGKFNAGIRKVN